jgi:hypothetical protein
MAFDAARGRNYRKCRSWRRLSRTGMARMIHKWENRFVSLTTASAEIRAQSVNPEKALVSVTSLPSIYSATAKYFNLRTALRPYPGTSYTIYVLGRFKKSATLASIQSIQTALLGRPSRHR